ncbi:MAG: outer membrane protein assembly factor BamE domain-containing protein [Chromatiales bacterium]
MHLLRTSAACLLFASVAGLTACSGARIPSPADLPIVYKIDVQQGNVVTQEMLAQLEPGIDKAKVRYIMGTPLVVDVFHQDRWDYLYTMQKRGGQRVQRRVSLYFKNDQLDHIDGDVKPASGEFTTTGDGIVSTTVDVPGKDEGLMSKLKDKVIGDEEGSQQQTAQKEATATAAPAALAEDTAAAPTGEDAHSSPYAVDNSAAGESAPTAPAEQTARTEPGAGESQGHPLLPTFQSESDLDEATVSDTPAADEKQTAAQGSSEGLGAMPKAQAATEQKHAAAGKTTEVVIPNDAPPPPQKGFFGRLLEKVGVGDNESGEYESADTRYKDPSNPDSP